MIKKEFQNFGHKIIIIQVLWIRNPIKYEVSIYIIINIYVIQCFLINVDMLIVLNDTTMMMMMMIMMMHIDNDKYGNDDFYNI